ncbi:MAG: carboxypeptidase regulatory-like domain-containing protein [Myxococcaceae bacterium]|nr:carboxypeptidase regulatory-like domain-containing protein [Myxococcaceae bacterium]
MKTLCALVHLWAGTALAGGTIAGTISFSGAAPRLETLDRRSDPYCPGAEVTDPTVTLSRDGKALANVVVRITEGAPAAAAPAEPLTIDQQGCMYTPRVQAGVLGQRVQVKNGDGTLHNVHGYSGSKTVFNQAQPPGSKPLLKELKKTTVLTLKCDVHAWMAAYVVLSSNAFFATTGSDGAYVINDVPPGRYTIEAWHEKLGTQSAEITVEEGKAVDPRLGFKG